MSSPLNADQLAQRLIMRLPQIAPHELPDLSNWFPVTLFDHAIGWRQVPERFTAPFFTDTLNSQPPAARRACVTPLQLDNRVSAQLAALDAVAPSAFIFHVSRCGSTLLCQMLASLPECIVISEAPMLDACLRQTPHDMPREAQITLLRQMVRALGQRRSPLERHPLERHPLERQPLERQSLERQPLERQPLERQPLERQPLEQHLFIKLDCWHLPYLPLLRAAFPTTPCWFLYREPGAVLASHQRQRGPQMVPGMVFPAHLRPDGDVGPELAPGDLDGYCLQVLHLLMQQALQYGAQLHLLNYSELPGALWQTLLPQLGINISTGQLHIMQARAGFHAKRQEHAFHGDPQAAHAAPALPSALQTLYAQLEQRRGGQAVPGNALV
jgi:hypothetical protein